MELVFAEIARYSFKGTFQFAELILERDMTEIKMASLDAISLCTNVPLPETTNYLPHYITVKERNLSIPVFELK